MGFEKSEHPMNYVVNDLNHIFEDFLRKLQSIRPKIKEEISIMHLGSPPGIRECLGDQI